MLNFSVPSLRYTFTAMAAPGWETYQARWSLNGAGPRQRLEDARGILFSNAHTNVRITDIGNGKCPCDVHPSAEIVVVASPVYSDGESLQAAIDKPVPNATRIRVM